ncbi:MAG: HEAT repeat domain-containing protein [Candidatus Heimdallarchaeota archaeon]|nr:HEAT repeat domain-containing protein [Candidatus Heimdallarchaeota archaeon]
MGKEEEKLRFELESLYNQSPRRILEYYEDYFRRQKLDWTQNIIELVQSVPQGDEKINRFFKKITLDAIPKLTERTDSAFLTNVFYAVDAGDSDEHFGVKSAVVKALDKIGDPRNAEFLGWILLGYVEDDKQITFQAIQALGRIKTHEAINALVKALEKFNNMNIPKEITAEIIKALEDSGDRLALDALHQHCSLSEMNDILSNFEMIKWSVQSQSWDFTSEEIEELIVEAQEYINEDLYVDYKLIEKLGETSDERAVDILNDCLQACSEDSNPFYIEVILKALGKLAHESSIPFITEYLHNGFGLLRVMAAESLMLYKENSLVKLILETLEGVYDGSIEVNFEEPYSSHTKEMFEIAKRIDPIETEKFIDNNIENLGSDSSFQIVNLLLDSGFNKVVKPVQKAIEKYPQDWERDYIEQKLLELYNISIEKPETNEDG